MTIIGRLTCLFLLMVCSFTVSAEGRCPPGYAPTTNPDFIGCAPIYNAGPSTGSSPNSAPKSADPGARRKFHWGAIVVDGDKGKFGGADGYDSPSQAEKAAVKICKDHGGKQCKLVLEYYNQCGALVWGDYRYSGHSGPDLNEVTKRAIDLCSEETSNCKIFYTGCSYPVEVE